MLAAEVIEEEIDEPADVVAPLAQRRYAQLEHAQPVVQILAEFLFGNVAEQVAVRGRDHAHVDLTSLLAPTGKNGCPSRMRSSFEPGQPHLADFVEKQRAQVGLLELADVVAVGAGERARLVAEELALHQFGAESPRN